MRLGVMSELEASKLEASEVGACGLRDFRAGGIRVSNF